MILPPDLDPPGPLAPAADLRPPAPLMAPAVTGTPTPALGETPVATGTSTPALGETPVATGTPIPARPAPAPVLTVLPKPPAPAPPGAAGRSRAPWPLLAAALAGVLIFAFAADGDDRSQPADEPSAGIETTVHTPADTSTAGGDTPSLADGMPIPGGNAPVEPVRIVVDLGEQPLSPAERRTLATWLAQTQHADTRVRIVRAGRATRPLSAPRLRETAGDRDRTVTRAARWLEDGERRAIDGGWLTVGGGETVPEGTFERLTVGWQAGDAAVQGRLANRIARQVMIISSQRFDGTTSP